MAREHINAWKYSNFAELDRKQLLARLRMARISTAKGGGTNKTGDRAQLLYELEVQQIQLNLQNRQLQESQQLLEESRSRYADLYEYCPAGLITVDYTGCMEQVNSTAASMFKLEKIRMVGFSLVYYVAPRERVAFLREIRRCLDGRGGYKFKSIVTFMTCGRMQNTHVSMRRTKSTHNDSMCVSVSLVDVSKQVALNEEVAFVGAVGAELSNTLERNAVTSATLEMAVPKLADLALMTYVGADVRDGVDQGCVNLRSDEEVWPTERSREIYSALREMRLVERCQARRELIEWAAKDSKKGIAKEAWSLLKANNVAKIEAWPLGRCDEVFAVLLLAWSGNKRQQSLASASVLLNFVRRVALSLDNVRLYRLAQAQIKARSEFLAIVAHDLRNPLAVVSMQAERLGNDKKWVGEPKIKKYAETIVRCVGRMDTLVRDLLDAASMDGRQLSVAPLVTSVKKVLHEEGLALSSIADRKNVIYCEEIGEDLQLFCDPRRSSQVLENIVANAVKFTQPGGRVTLKTERRGEKVQFSIRDTGCGMNEVTRARVFEQFWQARPAAKGGVGLGLCICKNIVETSGGEVWVESEEGHGSTFFFTLPSRPPQKQPQTQTPPIACLGHLLLVDDDDIFRANLAELLVEQGYSVSTAENGESALAWLQGAKEPDMIILDLQMPVMDGFAFLQRRALDVRLAAISVIVLSAAIHEKKVALAENTHMMYKLTPIHNVLQKIAAVSGH